MLQKFFFIMNVSNSVKFDVLLSYIYFIYVTVVLNVNKSKKYQ